MKSDYRIGRRNGQPFWQVKAPPNWKVIGQFMTLAECEQFLRSRSIDPAKATVCCNEHPWPNLVDLVKKGIEP